MPSGQEHIKERLLQCVSDYADKSSESKGVVLVYFDKVLREGIKDIQIRKAILPTEMEVIFKDEQSIMRHFSPYLPQGNLHFVDSQLGVDFRLINVKVFPNDDLGRRVTLLFACLLNQADLRASHWSVIEYPVVVDYLLDKKWLVLQYKPRSNLYRYDSNITTIEGFLNQQGNAVNINNLLNELEKKIQEMFCFSEYDKEAGAHEIRRKFFQILDQYTHTPQAIQDILDGCADERTVLAQRIAQICNLQNNVLPRIEADIKDMMEKFISINWEDKRIFITDREAYPIKLSATDEEESRVEQTSATDLDPLQSKEVFFDNKRMLCNNQLCDGITLMWKRRNRMYYSSDYFPVKLSERKGICTLTFKKYTAEEDVQNVLFSIIRV